MNLSTLMCSLYIMLKTVVVDNVVRDQRSSVTLCGWSTYSRSTQEHAARSDSSSYLAREITFVAWAIARNAVFVFERGDDLSWLLIPYYMRSPLRLVGNTTYLLPRVRRFKESYLRAI